MTTGTEALSRLLARREARVAAFTKGEGGLFTGSEPGTHAGHRDGEGHSDSRIHRAIGEGIDAMKNSSVSSRSMEFTHEGETRTMVLSNVRETTRPDTPNSEIAPTVHQAAANRDGATLDRPIVVDGWAVDVHVLGAADGHKGFDDSPGMTRDVGGGTAMMGAAEDTAPKAPAAPAPAPAKPVVVQAPPAEPAKPDAAKVARDLQDNAERDQRISDLEGDVRKIRTELDGMQELAVDDALSEMDAWTEEGGEAAMPHSMVAAVGRRSALPPAFIERTVDAVALPPSMVASVEEKHQLPGYRPGAFTAGNYTKGDGGLFTGSEAGGGKGKDDQKSGHKILQDPSAKVRAQGSELTPMNPPQLTVGKGSEEHVYEKASDGVWRLGSTSSYGNRTGIVNEPGVKDASGVKIADPALVSRLDDLWAKHGKP